MGITNVFTVITTPPLSNSGISKQNVNTKSSSSWKEIKNIENSPTQKRLANSCKKDVRFSKDTNVSTPVSPAEPRQAQSLSAVKWVKPAPGNYKENLEVAEKSQPPARRWITRLGLRWQLFKKVMKGQITQGTQKAKEDKSFAGQMAQRADKEMREMVKMGLWPKSSVTNQKTKH